MLSLTLCIKHPRCQPTSYTQMATHNNGRQISILLLGKSTHNYPVNHITYTPPDSQPPNLTAPANSRTTHIRDMITWSRPLHANIYSIRSRAHIVYYLNHSAARNYLNVPQNSHSILSTNLTRSSEFIAHDTPVTHDHAKTRTIRLPSLAHRSASWLATPYITNLRNSPLSTSRPATPPPPTCVAELKLY